jgi:uncharacterized protein involved in response to NO
MSRPVPISEANTGGNAASLPPGGFALWNLGFRPFYLLAGLFAALSVFCWIAQLAGWLGSHAYLRGPMWHAHEMIFGYAFAVIVGFLFTAVRNWTERPTPTGSALAVIAALWMAARILVLTPWTAIAVTVDVGFAIAAAVGIAVPLIASRNQRNYFFIALILAMGAANLLFHLAMAGVVRIPAHDSLQSGLDLILIIMAVMGGRVIPMFTANGAPGSNPVRLPWLERAALGSLLALFAVDLAGAPAVMTAVVCAACAIAHAARLALWHPWRTLKRPIVWILHAAYAWIVVYLAMRSLAAMDIVPATLASHALTVGAIGGLTLGMMTRTARGHTGLPLQVGSMETMAYALVQISALVRVFLPLAAPGQYQLAVTASGLLWVAAFTLFTVKYWPILSRPRADGRSG